MAPSPSLGSVLAGRYRLVRLLGAGGNGQVFEAEQIGLGRRVAVKVLHEADANAIARLRQEATAAGALRHPNVVAVLDFVAEPGDDPFLVMELLEGESLASLGRREAPLAPARAVRIVLQVLEGLAAAHRAGLVHRDVKPANVWVTPTLGGEFVKLLDFGLVRAGDVRLTATGYVVGTPQFLAPEQLRADSIDGRVDLHAVGLVLWMLIVGRLPWRADVPIASETLLTVPPALDTLVPGLPAGLSDVVARALAKEQDARWPSAEDMHRALAPFAEGSAANGEPDRKRGAGAAPTFVEGAPKMDGPPPPRPRETRPRRRPRAVVFVAGLLVPLVAAAAMLPWLLRLRAREGPDASRGVDASRAVPSADVPDEAPVAASASSTADADGAAPPPPTLHAPAARLRLARAGDRNVCACIADISPRKDGRVMFRVCPIPHAPECRCNDSAASPLCPQPHVGGVCGTPRDSYPPAPEQTPCEGYGLDGEGVPQRKPGKLECARCTGAAQLYVGASEGQPCRGLHDGADRWFDGAWACFAR